MTKNEQYELKAKAFDELSQEAKSYFIVDNGKLFRHIDAYNSIWIVKGIYVLSTTDKKRVFKAIIVEGEITIEKVIKFVEDNIIERVNGTN